MQNEAVELPQQHRPHGIDAGGVLHLARDGAAQFGKFLDYLGLGAEEGGVGLYLGVLIAEPVLFGGGGLKFGSKAAADPLPLVNVELAAAVVVVDAVNGSGSLRGVPFGGGEQGADLGELLVSGLLQLHAGRLKV